MQNETNIQIRRLNVIISIDFPQFSHIVGAVVGLIALTFAVVAQGEGSHYHLERLTV